MFLVVPSYFLAEVAALLRMLQTSVFLHQYLLCSKG